MTVHRRIVAWVATVALLLAGPVVGAARADDVSGVDTGEQMVSLDFDNVELTDVIDTIARMTDTNFIYDDRVRGRVTIVSPTPIPVSQAYAVFESVLQVKGFTTVQTPGGALKVIPVRDAKESNVETVLSSRRPPNRDRYVTRLIPLRYIEADSIVKTLKPLVSKDAAMEAYEPTNMVILTESSSNIRRIIDIIESIDVDSYRDEIAVIRIEYADASTLAGQIAEIYDAQVTSGGSSSPTTGARAARRARAARARASATNGSAGGGGRAVRLITDERTNSIIVMAARAQMDDVRELIHRLDVPVKGGGSIHVYYLQHADAEELAQTLAALISGTPKASSTGGGGAAGGGAPQSIRTAVTALAEGVAVTADPATNSLVIQARKEGYDAIVEVIELLDVERPQVLVEALIMEADVSDGRELGFNGIYKLMTEDLNLTVASLTDAAARGALASQGLDASFPSAFGTLFSSGDPDNGSSIQGLIRATANNAGVNIVSAPHILTSDNEEAEIRIGDNIPIITSRVQSAQGVVGSDNLATSVNVERQDIGVTLRVTPQITEGDSLRLDIFQEITDVNEALDVGNIEDVGVPLSSRRIENTVVVRDGDTVVVGGLISDRYVDEVNKVPWLGDIPIIGWAFKTTIRALKKVNLLVFLTPHIVRTPSELEFESIRKREEFTSRTESDMDISVEERWAEEQRWNQAKARGEPYPIVAGRNPVRNRVLEVAGKHPLDRMREIEAETRAAAERERAAAEAANHAPVYLVQMNMGSDEQAATELLTDLVDAGYRGSLVSRDVGGSILMMVVVGPYAEMADARLEAENIARVHGVHPSVVVEVPKEP